jgi:hypothetical protein
LHLIQAIVFDFLFLCSFYYLLLGLNNEYLKFIKSMVITQTQNEYVQGLKDCKNTFEQSKVKSRFEKMDKLRSQKNRNRDKGLEQ